jgi:hypothetical protein
MSLTRRAISIGAFCWLMLAGALGGLTTVGSAPGDKPAASKPATTKPSSKPATTKASTRPTTNFSKPLNETVSIDLKAENGPFVPRARGVMRPIAAPAPGQPAATPPTLLPTRQLLAPLGPLAEGRGATEVPTLITLADAVKFDGPFPGAKAEWSKWDAGVAALVKQNLADRRPVVYEVCKEPDDKASFKGDRLDYFSAWVRTYNAIRAIAPDARVLGPGTAKFDHGWIQEFLKVCKEFDALPEVISWHEDSVKHDVAGHLSQLGETFWQDGSAIGRVSIGASAGVEAKRYASDPAIFMAQMEKAVKDNAWRPLTAEFEFKLTHLFTPDLKPRSIYHTWREYAAMANAGRSMKVSSSQTADGVAVWDGQSRTCRVLIGRNKSRIEARQVLGTFTVQVKGANGATIHVKGVRIPDSGSKASDGPSPAWNVDVPIKSGEANIPIKDIASGDAYSLEITVRGLPPSPAPTPKPKPTANASQP